MIKDNISIVEERIEAACKRSGRDVKEVTLIAVSKTKPVSMLKEAYETGIRTFGENKVQELVDKTEQMPEDIKWHMIGHLQRNKVKYLIGKTALIHSVDTYRLAEQINIEAKKNHTVMNVLIEVNIADEESKFGVRPDEVSGLIHEISTLDGIRVKGLMTVAPYTENAEENRGYFKKMHQLYVDINAENIDNVDMDILSMGMTGDYEIAIEEGATMVRVGTGIFGERNYGI